MTRCLLALGSNMGDRPENLSRATGAVAELPGSRLLARSRWHETAPIGGPDGQGPFLNGSLLLDTRLSPVELSHALQAIERSLGRERSVRWDARVIDIDLLLYGQMRIASQKLFVPHPRMSFRRFVLEPASEIAGSMVEPTTGWTLCQLLRHLDNSPRYVALAAAQPEHATRLARALAKSLGSPHLEALLPSAGTGADSPSTKRVELTAVLGKSAWRKVPELAARLPGKSELSLPPVVSGFWCRTVPSGCVRPALVIAWDFPGVPATVAAFQDACNRPGHGPLARVAGEDFSTVLLEAAAAIRAVWPQIPPAN